jgi:hypothetical protein
MTQTEENALALEYGLVPIPDPRRGDGWCKFVREEWTVWQCRHRGVAGWAAARMTMGHYTQHDYHGTLAAAFEHVQKILA